MELLVSQILAFPIIIINLFLGFWVYLSNRKLKANQLFFLITLFAVLWIICGFFAPLSNQFDKAVLLYRINMGAVVLFIMTGYFFIQYFPQEEKQNQILKNVVLMVGIIIFLISVATNLIIKNVEFKEWGTDTIFGKGISIYYGIIVFLIFLTAGRLLKKYFLLPKTEKLKIQYFLVGVLLLAIINLVFNIILPWQSNTYKYAPLGDYSLIFFLGFTAYAIVKRELFGIRVVLTQILVGVIAIVLLVQVLGSATIFEYIWKGAIFLVFLFFGFLLIRSVMREIKLREALQQAYAKLQVLDKAKSEFISIASHQLRTPLTAIKGYISMILEGSYGEMPEKAQRPVENVYKSAERLINLVNDLLSVSRLEAGKIKVEPKKACIEEMILGIIEELKIKADEKKIYLKFQQPLNPLPKVIIDPDKIRQVILNIIDNAIRYTTVGGIRVEAEIKGPKFKVIISDTGEGMTREEISNMFESFSRGTAGGRLWTEGSGLGLYVSRRFVEMHQGKVWVKSEGKGKGSTFFIELPRKPENQKFNEFMKAV